MKCRLAASLESRNTAPTIENSRRRPAFDLEFDWTEQNRVWKAIQDLIGSPVDRWNSLSANIESTAYCITVESASGAFYNWTVGDVCRIIISRTLSEPYFRSLSPITPELYAKFRSPGFARDPQTLKDWLVARHDRTLSQLQVEACEVAIDQLSHRDDDNREKWLVSIRATVTRLRDGGMPILYEGFGADEFRPCKSSVAGGDPFAGDRPGP